MIIQSLTYLKRRGGPQVEVGLDDGSILALDAELAVRFQLKTGMEVSDETRERLEREQARLSARRRLIRYLALRKKTAREAAVYLEHLGFPEEAVSAAVEAARELGFIDDARFAGAYARTQERSAKKGPRAIRQELMMRGVDKDLANDTVAPSEAPEVQRARAREVAAKKAATLAREDPRKARQKLHQYLVRKGYDPEIASEVAREVLDMENEE